MDRKSSLAIAMIAAVSSGCATFEQYRIDTGEAAGRAVTATHTFLVDTTDAAIAARKSARQRMSSYLERKELLKTFHDAEDYGEDAIVYLRRRTSIGGFGSGKLPKFKAIEMPDLPAEYAGEYHWPVEAGVISSEYGKRFGKLHKGIDVAADIGEPIHAIADGYVIYAGNKVAGYGNLVVLQHDESTMSLYAHNSRMKVKTGQRVAQGQIIALLGNSGRSTGPHSHFETRRLDVAVNPREFLVGGPFEEPRLQGQLDPLREFLVASRGD